MPHSKTIDKMEAGTEAVIIGIKASSPFRRRLMELGFVSGTSIQCVCKSKITDSVTYRIRGATINFRVFEAESILIL